VGRFLIWLSGARRQILAECPTERPKYIGIGTAILITAAMAAVSLSFALITILKVRLWVALPFAVAWGLAIMSLDRLFVVSLYRQGHWWTHIFRALPRFLLSLLLGAVISTPFVLQIFHPEIEQEISVLQTQAAKAYAAQLGTGQLATRIVNEQQNVSALESQAGTGGSGINLATNGALQKLRQELAGAQTTEQNDYNELNCQLYDIPLPNGTKCPPGDGEQAKNAQQAYNSAQGQVNQLQAQLSSQTQQLQTESANLQSKKKAQAIAELPATKLALQADLTERQQEIDNFNSANQKDSGLLISLKALDDVTAGNSTLAWARWLLFALFVAIDCMPVLIKIMLNMGPAKNYDKMLEAEEKKQLRVASSNRGVRQSAEIMDTAAAIEEGRSRIAGWNTELPDVTAEIIDTRTQVERARLKAWEDEQLRLIGAGQGTGPGGNGVGQEPAVTFLTWPWITGSAIRGRTRLRVLRWRAFRWLDRLVRSPSPRSARHKVAQAPYGAPFSPRMASTPNGDRKSSSRLSRSG
jgi:hypothetical protein